MNQKRVGIVISYINLVLGMCVSIFLTPFLIKTLGDADYSIYKIMQAFAGPLSMFHLGISTVVTRCIVKFNSQSIKKKEKDNTLALSLLSASVMAIIAIIAALIMFFLIPSIYSRTMDVESIKVGQRVFLLFAGSSVLHLLTDAFSGCLIGHEKYAVSSSITTFKTLLRVLLIFILLKSGLGVVWVVSVELIVAICVFVFTLLFAVGRLGEIPRLTYFDKAQLIEIVVFGLAVLMQAVVNQVNNNIDTIVLGAFIENKQIITMYSSALAIYAVFNSLISAVTHFFLPEATRLVVKDAGGRELTDFVVRPGRFQAMIAVGCICGFALFGKHFISIWIGPKYMDAYWVTLMLIIPVTIPLVENAAISILDASMKRLYRSIVLLVMAFLNVSISIVLVTFMGFWGAAIGTVLSLLIGHGLLMNLYYKKQFNMEIGRLFFSIFKGIVPAGIVSSLLSIPMEIFLERTVVLFLVKCIGFCVLYFTALWLFGINKYEKGIILNILKKRRKKINSVK